MSDLPLAVALVVALSLAAAWSHTALVICVVAVIVIAAGVRAGR